MENHDTSYDIVCYIFGKLVIAFDKFKIKILQNFQSLLIRQIRLNRNL